MMEKSKLLLTGEYSIFANEIMKWFHDSKTAHWIIKWIKCFIQNLELNARTFIHCYLGQNKSH